MNSSILYIVVRFSDLDFHYFVRRLELEAVSIKSKLVIVRTFNLCKKTNHFSVFMFCFPFLRELIIHVDAREVWLCESNKNVFW